MPASASQPHSPPTLASRNLPRRVRALLEGILEYASGELERGIISALNDFEQQLFKFAEQARNNAVQVRWLEAQRLAKRTRPDLIPRFLIALESELASIREPIDPHHVTITSKSRALEEMSLVNEVEMDEASVLIEASSRTELRNSLPLYLLGQRFGVLAGRPAMDAAHLPIGPQALCRMIRQAADCLELNEEHRQLFFRSFDRNVMPLYGHLVETVNTYLAKQGVLSHLQYVPVRIRPTGPAAAKPAETASDPAAPTAPKHAGVIKSFGLSIDPAPSERSARAQMRGAVSDHDPHALPVREVGVRPVFGTASAKTESTAEPTAPPPTAPPGDAAEQAAAAAPTDPDLNQFLVMRQLLAGRRQLLGKLNPDRTVGSREAAQVIDSTRLQSALGRLQSRPPAPVMVNGKATTRSVGHLKQEILALLRQNSPEQMAPTLAEEDGDAIDLVGMLFDTIMKDVKPHSPAASLLAKLQVPLLRVALQDKQFFTRGEHPARQMLNTVAETGTYWLSEDDADQGLVHMMNAAVDRTVRDFDGDLGLFNNLLADINSHLQTVTHKAEVAERRHVEAARGKEKLALARGRASEEVESLLKDQNLPRFTHTLLSQAWTDVMALTALRHGDDSDVWKQQLEVAGRLVQIAKASPAEQAAISLANAGLQQEIEQALSQVGYQGDEASAIAQRLVNPASATEGDAASRTELTMRMKSRARLGVDTAGKKAKKAALPPDEQAQFDQLVHTPFGTWFEFVTNQQGDKSRQRLSWFSTLTGNALFVNHRGQKVGEHTLDQMARLMAHGQLHMVEPEKGSMIDRAWASVMGALKSFAGQAPTEAHAQ
jgi:hypothetical protein